MKEKLKAAGKAAAAALVSPDARRYEIAVGILVWEAIRRAVGW